MKVLPTLNIQNGRVVPILASDPLAEVIPIDVVGQLLARGCCRFTLLDADAARNQGDNRELVCSLMRKVRQMNSKVCIQVGGGIRSSDQAQYYFDHGATWLLLGTVIHRYPMVVDQLVARFRDQLVASIDARDGEVQASGWTHSQGLEAATLAKRIVDQGFKRILYMDIPSRSGAEPDFEMAQSICEASHVSLFMGGSIRTQAHMFQAAELKGLQGVLIDALTVLNHPEMIQSSTHPCV